MTAEEMKQEQEQEFDSVWESDDAPETPEETETHESEEEEEGAPENEGEGQAEETQEEEETPEEMQRRKSWEGRLRKREEELRAREQEILAMQQQRQDSQKAPEQEIDENDPEWQQLVEDLGEDLALRVRKQAQSVTQKAMQSELDKVRQEMQQQLEPLTKQQQEVQAQQHVKRITEKHPDAFDLVQSGDIQAWVEEKPAYLQPAYRQVIEQGDADSVVAMLDEFKQSRKTTTKQPKAPPDQAVKSRRSGRVRTTAAAKDDFDAAWDEAVRSE
jgi:hypothetical protein